MPVLEGMSISKSISPTSSTVTVNEEAGDLAPIVRMLITLILLSPLTPQAVSQGRGIVHLLTTDGGTWQFDMLTAFYLYVLMACSLQESCYIARFPWGLGMTSYSHCGLTFLTQFISCHSWGDCSCYKARCRLLLSNSVQCLLICLDARERSQIVYIAFCVSVMGSLSQRVFQHK